MMWRAFNNCTRTLCHRGVVLSSRQYHHPVNSNSQKTRECKLLRTFFIIFAIKICSGVSTLFFIILISKIIVRRTSGDRSFRTQSSAIKCGGVYGVCRVGSNLIWRTVVAAVMGVAQMNNDQRRPCPTDRPRVCMSSDQINYASPWP